MTESKWMRRGMAAALLLFLGAGCAQDVGDIDRTGVEKIEKALFQDDAEWFFQQTIVETDIHGSPLVFTAYESPLKRIRWQITEDVLYAMSTVEPAPGLYDGIDDEESRRLGIVAAFPITTHFDVQRSYNAATGEQSNVISENTSDRNWYERDYMRVNWNQNLLDGVWMFGSIFGQFSSLARTVPADGNEANPFRTRIDYETGYVDAVTEYYFQPDLYVCYTSLGYDGIFNCESGPVKIRNSFSRISPEKTYEPLQFTDNVWITDENGDRIYTTTVFDRSLGMLIEMECTQEALNYGRRESGSAVDDRCRPATFDMFTRFGYFRTERVRWHDGRGANVEDNRLYYANRWNIWQTMFDEDGSLLDTKDRVPKPIVTYLNPEYPLDMLEAAAEVEKQWDDAFSEAVRIAKGLDTREEVRELLVGLYGDGRMYQINPNNCSAQGLDAWYEQHGDVNGLFAELQSTYSGNDLEAKVWAMPNYERVRFCARLEHATADRDRAQRFDWQRLGDIRYSFFQWVEEDVPWLGYGPSGADPLTGEIIRGNANFAGKHLRTYGPIAADYVQYMNGELSEQDIIYGEHVSQHLRDVRRNRQNLEQETMTPEGKEELARRAGMSHQQVREMNFDREVLTREDMPMEIQWSSVRDLKAEANRAVRTAALARASDTRGIEFFEQPLVKQVLLRDPQFSKVIEANAIARFGPQPELEHIHQAYVDVTAPMLTLERENRRERFFSDRNIMGLHVLENAAAAFFTYSGAAEHFRGEDRDVIGKYFIDKIFIGTQLHEIGHAVGLRHNFEASTDALNYPDEFWLIQKAILEGRIEPEDRWNIPAERVVDIVGPELANEYDYISEAEFRIASVMDYAGDFTARFQGMGKYDQAAINFAYAEAVEVWDNSVQLPPDYDFFLWIRNYQDIPLVLTDTVGEGTVQDYLDGIDIILNGRTHIPITQAIAERREGIRANTANWCDSSQNPGCTLEISPQNPPHQDRAVPYSFCSDDQRGLVLNCDVWDFGANQREIINHAFDSYRYFSPFRRYKGHRIFRGYENLFNYQNWVIRTFATVQQAFRYYSFYQWFNLGDYTDDLRDAAIDAINLYAEVLAQPQPGRYCQYSGPSFRADENWYFNVENTYIPANLDRNFGDCSNYIDIPRGPGQFYNYQFTQEYDYRIERVGTFIDKALAVAMLFGISGDFLQSAFFTDFRATNVSYWTLFRDEVYELLRGVFLGDYHSFAGAYDATTGSYITPRLVDQKTFGTGLDNPLVGRTRVYTPISFTHKFNMLAYSMIYNNTWLDRATGVGTHLNIAVTSTETQPFPEGTEYKQWIHPITSQIYSAAIPPDGRSITGDLIDWANTISADLEVALERRNEAEPGTTTYSNRNDLVRYLTQQLEDIGSKLDMIRYIWDALGADSLR